MVRKAYLGEIVAEAMISKIFEQCPSAFFFKGFIIGISIAAPVGPIGVLCIRRTLAEGRTSGSRLPALELPRLMRSTGASRDLASPSSQTS